MKKLLAIAMLFSMGTIHADNVRLLPASVITTVAEDTRTPIKLKSLPKDAFQFIKENYPLRQIQEVSKLKSDDSAVKYEVAIQMEGKTQIVQFDKKGELVNELQK